jgi:protein tyrosine phosphatase (PTP) superfamily phosphohydrolase (DUF442 family)
MGISHISDQVYVSGLLKAKDAEQLRARGVRLILNMIPFPPAGVFKQPPFQVLTLPTLDSPITPMPIRFLRKGVEAALPVIGDGGGVLTYCRAGRHRSVAMAACILIALGHSADDAMHSISARRTAADPYARHIQRRIRKFEREWSR